MLCLCGIQIQRSYVCNISCGFICQVMIYKYMTYHVVLFIKENRLENRFDQRDQKAPTIKSLQWANLNRESQAKSHQESKADQIATSKSNHPENKVE